MTQPTQEGEDSRELVSIGFASLSVADVVAVARDGARLELERDPAYRARLEAGRRALETALRKGVSVYGVTTGVGASQGREVPEPERKLVTQNLLRFHGCGTGRILDERGAAAVVVARLASLARGYSGVRPVVLERLCELQSPHPAADPEEGRSARAATSRRSRTWRRCSWASARRWCEGEWCRPPRRSRARASAARARAQGEPRAHERHQRDDRRSRASASSAPQRLARWACALTAMTVRAIAGNPRHFDRAIFELKPHPGTRRAAAWIREDLEPRRGAARRRACRTLLGALRAARDRRAARRARVRDASMSRSSSTA